MRTLVCIIDIYYYSEKVVLIKFHIIAPLLLVPILTSHVCVPFWHGHPSFIIQFL